jgi:hypothetical protein
MKRVLGVSIALAFVCVCSGGAADSAVGDPKHTIRLHNREFKPSPGIEADLRKAVEKQAASPVYGLIQMPGDVNNEQRMSLGEAGVELRQFIGGTAYLAKFRKDVDFDRVEKQVRWAGLLLPEDKTEKALWQGKIEPWAKADASKVKVLVTFHLGVTREEAQKILTEYNVKFRKFGMNPEWAVEIPLNKVKLLAEEHAISWLEQGPSGFQPLSVSGQVR